MTVMTTEGGASTPDILDAWQRGWLAAQARELPPMAPAFARLAGVAWVVALEGGTARARAELHAIDAYEAGICAARHDPAPPRQS